MLEINFSTPVLFARDPQTLSDDFIIHWDKVYPIKLVLEI